MQAVVFPGYGRAEIIDVPRPVLTDPGDALVLVTTAAIGPWDIDRFLTVDDSQIVPGGEFAGIVVGTGENVSTIEIDDLVANTVWCSGTNSNGDGSLFGGLVDRWSTHRSLRGRATPPQRVDSTHDRRIIVCRGDPVKGA